MSESKKKIYIAIVHLGALRYFEKLVPRLSEAYEVVFLFTPKALSKNTGEEFAALRAYATQGGYATKQIGALPPERGLPFFSVLASWRTYQKEVKTLLSSGDIACVLGDEDTNFYNNCLFHEANKRGIATVALQWSLINAYELNTAHREHLKSFHRLSPLQKLYAWTLRRASNLLGMSRMGSPVVGCGTATRFGVLNQPVFELLSQHGVPREKMRIVGSVAWTLAKEKNEKLKQPSAHTEISQKYGIDPSKKIILIFTTPYDIPGVMEILTQEEQQEYYRAIIRAIQKHIPPQEATIVLKIHHRESLAMYQPLIGPGVAVLDKIANNEEVVALSDIYIADGSTANFIPMAMGKDALFIHFLNIPIMLNTREFLGIKKFITSMDEFSEHIRMWKTGTMPAQYAPGSVDTNAREKILDFIIGQAPAR